MSVERFNMRMEYGWACARADEAGVWVRYSDFATLSAKMAEAERELDVWRKEAEIPASWRPGDAVKAINAQRNRADEAEARANKFVKALYSISRRYSNGASADTLVSIARAAIIDEKEPSDG